MTVTNGWDALALSLQTNPEGVELRIGVVFVLALAGIAWWLIDGWEDGDDGPKAA